MKTPKVPWNREDQLAGLEQANSAFIQTVLELTPEAFLNSLGGWSPRDLTAHLIGWNRSILVGCKSILEGEEPFYHFDGPNDYHRVNATYLAVFPSTGREELLFQLDSSNKALVSFLSGVKEQDWNRDTGVVHYRGGPASVARSIDSLTRDYRNHQEEIMHGFPTLFGS